MEEMRPASGSGELHIGWVRGSSAVLRSRARSPMCLLTPQPRGSSVWACTSSLGGGMVAGDEISLAIEIDAGARCYLGTQSSTKIYRNPLKRRCHHSLQARLAADSLLVLAPDPVQCFADSSYQQEQAFHLASGANLVLLDWFSAGRLARGERWQFERYASRNEIRRDGEIAFLDALELDAKAAASKFRSGRFNCLATLVFSGPMLQSAANESLALVQAQPVRAGASLVISASPLRDGAIIRIAAASVAEAAAALSSHLSAISPLLQDNPWARKW